MLGTYDIQKTTDPDNTVSRIIGIALLMINYIVSNILI